MVLWSTRMVTDLPPNAKLRIHPVSPTNFLYNMVKIFSNTGNALAPSRLRTPFGARHESTSRFAMIVTTAVCRGGRSVVTPPLYVPNCLLAPPALPALPAGRVGPAGRAGEQAGRGGAGRGGEGWARGVRRVGGAGRGGRGRAGRGGRWVWVLVRARVRAGFQGGVRA